MRDPARTQQSSTKLTIGRTDVGNLSIIESIPQEKRVVVQLTSVSASVPNFMAGGGGWRKHLNKLRGKKDEKASDEIPSDEPPPMRQVSIVYIAGTIMRPSCGCC